MIAAGCRKILSFAAKRFGALSFYAALNDHQASLAVETFIVAEYVAPIPACNIERSTRGQKIKASLRNFHSAFAFQTHHQLITSSRP